MKSTANCSIGMIAGSGLLPFEIAQACLQANINCITVGLENIVNQELVNLVHNHQIFRIGQVGAIINYFKEYKVENIVLAGGVERPSWSSIKLDFTGSLLLAEIVKNKYLGDDAVLKIIANFLEKKGFKVISPIEILTLNTMKLSSDFKPSKQDKLDIEIGLKVLEVIGDLDIGQAVIIENGYILGVEAAEGTDNLIKRCSTLRKKSQSGVLVKALKKNQDIRFDIPTIGPTTIANLVEQNYAGIAIKKDQVIILDASKTYELANRSKIFIEVV